MSTDLFRKVAIILEEEIGSEGEEGEGEASYSPPASRTWYNGREGEGKGGEERGSSDHESDNEDVDAVADDVGADDTRPTTSSPPLPALTSKRTMIDAEDVDFGPFRARSDPR